MTGKDKCNMLRELRRQIALENDIRYVTEDCKYKGKCKGTCPKCESEVAYLERELEKRKNQKKRVSMAVVSVGAMLAMTGCSVEDTARDIARGVREALTPDDAEICDMGEIQVDGEIDTLEGVMPYEDDVNIEVEEGEVADYEDIDETEYPDDPDEDLGETEAFDDLDGE